MINSCRAGFAAILIVLLIATRAATQSPLWAFLGPPAAGASVTGVGDLDADGRPDFAYGSPTPYGSPPVVIVRSGRTGAQIHTIAASTSSGGFGFALGGAGDVDLDGVPDLVVGEPFATAGGLPEAGRAIVYSGADGSVLWTANGGAAFDHFGWSAAGVGDFNGDGRTDVVVGAPDADSTGSNAGLARVLSGAAGLPLATWVGAAAGDRFGYSVAGAGDVLVDGLGDVIVGAPFADPAGLGDAGVAHVYSVASAGPIRVFAGSSPGENFGTAVGNGGRMDADFVADLVVGAPAAFVTNGYEGRVTAFSGASGGMLWTVPGTMFNQRTGTSVAGMGDVDGDGRGDVVFAAPAPGNPGAQAAVVSGATGQVIFSLAGPVLKVSALGDADGDGRPEFIAGATGGVGVYWRNPAAPRVMLRLPGDAANHRIGESTTAGIDVDGDSVPDVAGGSSILYTAGLAAGRVRIWSGKDGSTLRTMDPPNAGDRFGTSIAFLHDLDGDGRGEILIGAPRTSTNGSAGWGYAEVRSPATGAVLLHLDYFAQRADFGAAVARIGDVDADGYDDFAVDVRQYRAVPGGPITGLVRLHSGRTGGLLREIPTRAMTLDGPGDVDGDTVPDLLTQNAVFSGATGSLHLAMPNAAASAGIGDVDGDGSNDVVVIEPAGGALVTVRLLSGFNGTTRWTRGAMPELAESFDAVVSVADLDADGRPDVAASGRRTNYVGTVPGVGSSFLRFYSGATGNEIDCINDSATMFLGSRILAAAGDLDGDHRGDLAIGWPTDGVNGGAGSVMVLAGGPLPLASLTSFGTGCGAPSGQPQAFIVGTITPFSPIPAPPTTVATVTLGLGTPSAPGWIFAGHMPAAPLTVSGCPVWIDPGTSILLGSFVTSPGGVFGAAFALPTLPSLTSSDLAVQALVAPTSGGFRLTNGLRFRFGY